MPAPAPMGKQDYDRLRANLVRRRSAGIATVIKRGRGAFGPASEARWFFGTRLAERGVTMIDGKTKLIATSAIPRTHSSRR